MCVSRGMNIIYGRGDWSSRMISHGLVSVPPRFNSSFVPYFCRENVLSIRVPKGRVEVPDLSPRSR